MLKLPRNEEKLEAKEYIVAYIDILGTKEKIEKEINNEYLNRLKQIYEMAKRFCNMELFKDSKIFPKLYYKIFSDNIVIATEMPKETYYYVPVIGHIIGFVAIYQAIALYNKILTRGAITIGELYLDDLFIYGKALVEAVELEENVAFYPRAILSSTIKKNYAIENSEMLVMDTDLQVFVNYYSMLTDTIGNRITNQEVATIKKFLVEERDKNLKNNKVLQKLNWLIQYHNSYVYKLIGTWDITEEYLVQPVNIVNEKVVTRNNSGSKKEIKKQRGCCNEPN